MGGVVSAVAGELVELAPDVERIQLVGEIAAAVSRGGGLAAQTIASARDVYNLWLSGKKPTTLRAYARDLADFAGFLNLTSGEGAIEALAILNAGQANRVGLSYRNDLLARKLSPATVARRLAALRSVVTMLRQLGRVTWSVEVAAPRIQAYRDTSGPGVDGWDRMLGEAKSGAISGDPLRVRNLAILVVLHDLALRRSELVGLDLVDVDGDAAGGIPSAVWILGKGRNERERLTLQRSTAKALSRWMSARGYAPGPLFVRLDRGAFEPTRLTDRSVHRLVGSLGDKAGVKRGRARPHGLRHQAITAALDACNDLRKVRSYSRHAKLDTLMKYDDNRKDFAAEVGRLVAGDDDEE